MYIFKNTEGYLRVVRMYYHQAFPAVSGGDGGAASGGMGQLLPPVDTSSSSGGGAGGGGESGEPPLDLDPLKLTARSDCIVDIRKLRAHEWHHIAVDWNDSAPSSSLAVYVDFQRVPDAGPYLPLMSSGGDTPTAWTRLNVRRPKDEFFIGGFIRGQGVADAGVFKWFTNTFEGQRGSGLMPDQAPTVKRVLANATIDELITYQGTFQSVKSYYGSGAPGYFTVQPGEYANLFEVPLPPEIDSVVLRSFDWTSYYPAFYTSREGQTLRVQTTPISCQIITGRTNIPNFDEPWRRRNERNPVANRVVMRRSARGMIGTNADLVYSFRIPSGRVMAGSMAGASVHTPVIDDVTLTYYLPDPKILIQEEAD
jgi:hypothetical protein